MKTKLTISVPRYFFSLVLFFFSSLFLLFLFSFDLFCISLLYLSQYLFRHAPEELRDEIFCQIIKQTTENPDPYSRSRGWQLMAIAAGTYPPSREFEPYLMYYCEQHKNDEDGIGELARGVQMRIKRIMDQGPRVNVPTDVEIEAVKHSTTVIMRVHLLDGGFAIVPVNSWTTVKEMHDMVTLKHNVRDGEPFAIYEISFPDEEERVLEETERVLDIVAYWQKTFDDDKAKNKKHGKSKRQWLRKREFFVFLCLVLLVVDMYFSKQIQTEH